jgi:hypothetical protein
MEKIAMSGMGKAPKIPTSSLSALGGTKSGAGVPAAQTVSVKPAVANVKVPSVPLASGSNAGRRSGASPQAITVPQFDRPNTQMR